jgi:hypothetical protein
LALFAAASLMTNSHDVNRGCHAHCSFRKRCTRLRSVGRSLVSVDLVEGQEPVAHCVLQVGSPFAAVLVVVVRITWSTPT